MGEETSKRKRKKCEWSAPHINSRFMIIYAFVELLVFDIALAMDDKQKFQSKVNFTTSQNSAKAFHNFNCSDSTFSTATNRWLNAFSCTSQRSARKRVRTFDLFFELFFSFFFVQLN